MDRVLIANAMIFDGSGAAPYSGDVLGEGPRIASVKRGGGLPLGNARVIDGDPLADIKRLQSQDALLVIMKDGRLHKAPPPTDS